MEKETKDLQTPAASLLERRAEFGARLAQARQGKGFSAPTLAQVTRIGAHFIAALEAGRFEALPGEVFGRGYVRCICKNLGVDSTTFITEFDGLWDKSQSRSVLQIEIKSRPTNVRRESWSRLASNGRSLIKSGVLVKIGAPAAAGVLLLYGLVATPLLSGLSQKLHGAPAAAALAKSLDVTHQSTRDAPAATTVTGVSPGNQVASASDLDVRTKTASQAAVNAAANPMARAAQLNSTTSPASTAVAVPTSPKLASALGIDKPGAAVTGTEQVLEIVVTEPVRIKIDVDQGQAVTKELTPDTYRFTFNQKADMMVYDAAAVKVNFNGKSLGNLGNKGRIRRLSFQAEPPADTKL